MQTCTESRAIPARFSCADNLRRVGQRKALKFSKTGRRKNVRTKRTKLLEQGKRKFRPLLRCNFVRFWCKQNAGLYKIMWASCKLKP